ncbi:MAG: hypothetical protein AAFR90_09830 [Pseudomonadota bacterium]
MAPKKSRWCNATFETLRAAFMRIAVPVEEMKTRIKLSFPSGCLRLPCLEFIVIRLGASPP